MSWRVTIRRKYGFHLLRVLSGHCGALEFQKLKDGRLVDDEEEYAVE